MRRFLVVAVVAATALATMLAVVAPDSLAGETTTAPGYNFRIDVRIDDHGVTLSRSVARRGWAARFVIHNRGKIPHRFEVGGLKTPLVKPGKKSRLGAQLENRGSYAYKVDNKLRGYFTVI